MISFFNKQIKKQYNQAALAAALAKVTGQVSQEELFTLYSHALQLKKGDIAIEIGSYKGKSSLALGLAAQQSGARVYCIDPHEEFVGVAGGIFGPVDLKDKINNISKFNLGDVLFPVCLSSVQVALIWEKPVNLLWIDGNHTYEFVSKDFNGFAPHVVPGGIIIFHDRQMEGVARLISEIDHTVFEDMGTVDSMALFRKK
jgi:predicted O-methyltransferase YrrM